MRSSCYLADSETLLHGLENPVLMSEWKVPQKQISCWLAKSAADANL